jgi:hypothetical protein
MPSDMSASRPAALRRGPSMKPRSKAGGRFGSRPAAGTGREPGCIFPARMRFKALADQDAVVAVELDHVGDGAERDQVEQAARLGSGRSAKAPRSRSSARSASMT